MAGLAMVVRELTFVQTRFNQALENQA